MLTVTLIGASACRSASLTSELLTPASKWKNCGWHTSVSQKHKQRQLQAGCRGTGGNKYLQRLLCCDGSTRFLCHSTPHCMRMAAFTLGLLQEVVRMKISVSVSTADRDLDEIFM